jgi:hypothetical protein
VENGGERWRTVDGGVERYLAVDDGVGGWLALNGCGERRMAVDGG